MRRTTERKLRASLRTRQLETLAAALMEERAVLLAMLRRLEAMQSERRRQVPDHRVAEVADLLDVHASAVYRLIDSGQLVAMRIGRCLRVRDEDLQDFRARMRVIVGDGVTGEAK